MLFRQAEILFKYCGSADGLPHPNGVNVWCQTFQYWCSLKPNSNYYNLANQKYGKKGSSTESSEKAFKTQSLISLNCPVIV